MAYVGHPGPNPMQAAAQTPFVAVFEIGQGNFNALVDNNGRAIAFFDFGYSRAKERRPPNDLVPCLCHDPLVILSHWDWDHIWMYNHVPEAGGLRWLAPEQSHSGFALKLRKTIKAAGGELVVWPTTDGLLSHMALPWGFLERCTETSAKTNGSGIAAFVCVRDDPANPPTVARTPTPARFQPAPEPASTIPERARRAYLAAAGGPYASAAQPLAVLLASSQTKVRHRHIPIRECVGAARAAADLVARGAPGVPTLIARLGAARVLPSLLAGNVAFHTAAVRELANAAWAMKGKSGYRRRVRAGADKFTYDKDVNDAKVKGLPAAIAIRAAIPVARAALPAVCFGLAPHRKAERFILLNGDADFQYVPSTFRRHPPVVVGLTAMHHGAVFEDSKPITPARIPWAPGSRAARAVGRVVARRRRPGLLCSLVSLAREAAVAGSEARKQSAQARGRARKAAARAACAAAAAVLAVEAAHTGQYFTSVSRRRRFAIVAAAAAAAAVRSNDAAVVGAAGALATVVDNPTKETASHPLVSVVDLAAWAVHAARNAIPITLDDVKQKCRGALDAATVRDVSAVVAQAVAGAGGGAGAAAQAAAQAVWNQAGLYTNQAFKDKQARKYRDRVDMGTKAAANRIMTDDVPAQHLTAAAADAAAPRRGSAHAAARAAGTQQGLGAPAIALLETNVRAAVRAAHPLPWPPTNIAQTAQAAAVLAAECAAAFVTGADVERSMNVIHAALEPRLARAARRAASIARPSGRIAYSYGVQPGTFTHEFETVVAGDLGHAHPLAIVKYEAHGWLERRNTSRHANHPGPSGDPDRLHSRGHVRLGWDSALDLALAKGKQALRCPTCGKAFRFST